MGQYHLHWILGILRRIACLHQRKRGVFGVRLNGSNKKGKENMGVKKLMRKAMKVQEKINSEDE
ncbi:hypothetical protein H5410_060150 [Solanum commersonii]|uniref:Uncharacterized protein n=1 Tax=Solanum commersonii TaxID=4109 RepID=A0A9J5W557_SOLCO|nr:hypothetical protein H5410_060150 [Solanum commersonii]